jgi:hypothetical protein
MDEGYRFGFEPDQVTKNAGGADRRVFARLLPSVSGRRGTKSPPIVLVPNI